MLVGANDGGVDLDQPDDVTGGVGLGRSRQESPVRILETIPLTTRRSSARGRPLLAVGISGANNSHSESVSSWLANHPTMIHHRAII